MYRRIFGGCGVAQPFCCLRSLHWLPQVNSNGKRWYSLVIFTYDSLLCKSPFMLAMDKFTVEHWMFLYEAYVKCKSARKCWEKIQEKLSCGSVSHWKNIQNLVSKIRMFILSKKPKCQNQVLTELMLDDTGTKYTWTFISYASLSAVGSKQEYQSWLWKLPLALELQSYKITAGAFFWVIWSSSQTEILWLVFPFGSQW